MLLGRSCRTIHLCEGVVWTGELSVDLIQDLIDGVVSAARLAASGTTSPSNVVELVGRQICGVLDLDDCRYEAGPSDPDRPQLRADGDITWRGSVVDVDREGLPTLSVIELPVTSAGVDHGSYLLTSTSAMRRPNRERRLVAITLAEQAAAAVAHGPPSADRLGPIAR